MDYDLSLEIIIVHPEIILIIVQTFDIRVILMSISLGSIWCWCVGVASALRNRCLDSMGGGGIRLPLARYATGWWWTRSVKIQAYTKGRAMSPQLKQILTDIDRLSATEQIEVISHTIELMKRNLPIESDESVDPDIGLEVKPEVIEQLLAIRQSKSPNLTTDEVKQQLGLV
jgi:hypothetical protein